MISVVFFIIAGACKAFSDVISFRFEKSIFTDFRWMNPEESSKNKWKNGDINQGERFPGSSTIFVWITDPWHFSNMIQYTAFALGVVFYKPMFNWVIDLIILKADWIIDFIILKTAFSIVFEILFRWGFIRK